MKKNTMPGMLIAALAMILLAACGGSGGGGGGGPAQPTTASIKIAVAGTPSNSPVAGIQVVLTMPSGVSVKTTQNAPQTDDNVVAASGEGADAELALGTYASSANAVTVYVTKSAGMAVGEFATVSCDIAAGTYPKAADFNVTNLSAWDVNGALVTGLTVTFTAVIK